MKTLEALLKEGTELLERSGIGEAGLDAWLLLEYAAGKSRAYYYAHKDEPAAPETEELYKKLCRERARHIPLQHLTGQAFFMGYEFLVNDKVLIPRQDTEILAEEALFVMKELPAPRILDMCTGSGCILISLLKEREDARGVGADLSSSALLVAKKNAEKHGVQDRAVFVESDTFSAGYFQEKDGKPLVKYDILISNPPYIPQKEIEGLMEEVRLYDPRMALDGGEDGLSFYRSITAKAGDYLKPGGWLLYEIGCRQGRAVSSLMKEAGFLDVKIKQDLSGLDRVVLGRKPYHV